MPRSSGTSRAIALVAIVAIFTACGGVGDSSSGSVPGDDPSADGASVMADSARIDTAASSDQTTSVRSRADHLTPDGWGPLRIGMTRAEVVAAAGEDAGPAAVGGPEREVCDEFRPSRAPAGLLVMVEDGILTRISVSRNPGISTPEGLRVGDASSSVLEAYGSRVDVLPHKYWDAPAKYITVWRSTPSSGERRGIRYEIGPDDRVVRIHAGGPSIEYVEGCL